MSCVLGRDTFSHRASLHPGVLMGTGELSGRPHKVQKCSKCWGGGGPCDGLASHRGGGRSNTPCRLIIHGTGRFELYISSLVKRFETSLVFPVRLKYLNLGINLGSRGGGRGERIGKPLREKEKLVGHEVSNTSFE